MAMDHVKGSLGSLFPKVMELLELVECKMQIDLNKEVGLQLKAQRELIKREMLSQQSERTEDEIDELLDFLKGLFECSIDQNKMLQSLETELVSLKSKLVSLLRDGDYIDAVLGKSPSSRLAVQVWAEVRELSYDVEDVVDKFLVCLQGSKPIEGIDTLKELVHKLSDLDLWEKIPADAMIKDVAARPASTATLHPRVQAAMYTEIPRLVGMRRNMDRLNHMISQYEDRDMPSKIKPKTTCVVGFGGLGKTTLVRTLYDKIKQDFSCKAFVTVGRALDKEKKVLMDILLALDKEKKEKNYTLSYLNEFDERQLIEELQEFLCKKRYLLVIDDIWEEKSWEIIQCAFLKECHLGSQVFTTTRSISLAKACCSSSDGRLIYQMEPLSDEDSSSLFYSRVFSQEGGQCQDDFKQVSAAILKKCGGVPLAIITIASLLASNGEGIKPISEWNHVLKSIGSGLIQGESVLEMNRILSLSYDDLPPELKNCLLYIAAFPEGYEIKKDHLVSKWIGEGFVQRTNQEDSLFEVADNYFNILINRSLIEPVKIDGEGKARACRVHDMVLGFLCSLSSEANFVTVIDDSTRTTSSSETRIRRLSIQNSMATPQVFIPEHRDGMAHVRSFTLSNSDQVLTGPTFYRLLCEAENTANKRVNPLESFQVLRVLDLRDCCPWLTYHQTPLYVRCVLQLRYLGLRNTIFNILPKDVGELKFLQILDFRNYNYIEELPSSIVELRELIYLRVDPKTRLPDDFGKLTSLEKLTHVMVNPDSAYVAKQLGYLTNLRVLRITPEDMDESLAREFVESLNKLLDIRTIEFRDRSTDKIWTTPAFHSSVHTVHGPGDCVRCMEESWEPSSHLQKFLADNNYCFRVLPKWITESCNISSLSICLKEVRRDDIEILGRLLYLRYLNIREEERDNMHPAKQEEGFQFENDAFPVARELRIAGIVMLPTMFPEGAMPKVQILEFHVRLEDFGTMNLEMGHLPALKQVKVTIWQKGNKNDFNTGNNFKAAVRAAADSHPNRPTTDIETRKYGHDENEKKSNFSQRSMPMWKNDDEATTDKQLRSSEVEVADIHTSSPLLHVREIGESSGFSSQPSLRSDEVKNKLKWKLWMSKIYRQLLRMWRHLSPSSSDSHTNPSDADVQPSCQTFRLTEIGEASGLSSQPQPDPFSGQPGRSNETGHGFIADYDGETSEEDDEETSERSMPMWENDDEATTDKQLRSSEVEAVDIHTRCPPPLGATEIGESSGTSSQPPQHSDEVKTKSSMWFMPMLEEYLLAETEVRSRSVEAVNVQSSHRPLRLTEIDGANHFAAAGLKRWIDAVDQGCNEMG